MALSFTVPVETGDMLSSSLGGGGQGGQKIHGNAVENVDVCRICCVYFCHVWLIHAFPFQFVSIVL